MKHTHIKTEHNQPIKKVIYQDIYSLHDLLEQLNSWNEPLHLLTQFFSDNHRPVNKKKIIKDYHSCSKIFSAFQKDFTLTLEKMNSQIEALRKREKI